MTQKPTAAPGGYREILRIAYPLFLFSASTIVMQFCDRKFLGNSSTEEIAASLPAGNLAVSLAVFFVSMLTYCSPLTAQLFGAKQKDRCVSVLWTGVTASLLCSAVMLLAMPLLGRLLLGISLKEQTFQYAFTYFLTQIPGQIAQCIGAPFFAFYAGRGRTLVVSCVNIGAALLNILLDWLLIFGHAGFPKLGIAGAGIATSLSLILGTLVIAAVALFEPDQNEYPTRDWRRFDRDLFRKILSLGGPSGFQRLSNSLKFTTMILLVGTLGEMALASTTISMSIITVSFMPLVSLAEANVILSGQFIGRGSRDLAEATTYRTWILAFGYTAAALICYIFSSRPMIDLFAPAEPSPELPFPLVANYAWKILIIMGIWLISDTGRYIFGSLLRAAGDTKALLRINLATAWGLGVPGFVVLALIVRPAVHFVWMYFIFVSLSEALIIYFRFRSGHWRKIELVHKAPEA